MITCKELFRIMSELVICAIFKNEADYLYEWLSFHSFLGVKHFYLYNNNSTDASLEVIASWPFSGTQVTVIDWPQIPGQNSAYRHMVSAHREENIWCAFIDCDEFLCPQTDASLQKVLDGISADCSALYVHWLMFGSSGQEQRQPGLVTQRFTNRSYDSFEPNKIGKTILRLSTATESGFCHIVRSQGTMVNDSGSVIDQNGNGIHNSASHIYIALNHYYTKSRQEWILRRSFGKADKPIDAPDFKRDEDDFYAYDQNVFVDLKAFYISEKMKSYYYPSVEKNKLASSGSAK